MKFKKGLCSKSAFSGQDITRFHNAASTGEDDVIIEYINKGIDVNSTDAFRGDTALIKAAKFCRISSTQLLLKNNADKNVKNTDGKKALDFAIKSSFHNGCNVLVSAHP